VIALDTNVLLHAHRAELPKHEVCLAALRRLAEGVWPWALPVYVVSEFVRVATHPRVFAPPSTLDQALGFLDALLGSPRCQLLAPGPGFVRIFDKLCREGDMRGNRAFDAQLAAVCVEHGVRDIVTLDRDMSRMPSIRPLSPERIPA
jgi:uncharacterized protein